MAANIVVAFNLNYFFSFFMHLLSLKGKKQLLF